MFERFRGYRRIFVTGPHRAGTTIASKMIAADTGHDLVLEEDYFAGSVTLLAAMLQAEYGPQVIQCPGLSSSIHDLDYEMDVDLDESLIVMMVRPLEEIKASEAKARFSTGLKVDFDGIAKKERRWMHTNSDRHPAELKYESWADQKPRLKHTLDLNYCSLKDHPLWVENRDFSLRQTSPDQIVTGDERFKAPPIEKELLDAIRDS